MSPVSFDLPSSDDTLLRLVQRCAAAEGVSVYLVGGYLRDVCLGRKSKDLDFVCLGQAASLRLAKAVAAAWHKEASCTIFARFGTAQVKHAAYVCEFVSARKESYRQHSRKPEVYEGTLDEDLARRDFSCNTLAYALEHYPEGELIDKFGGLEDLRKKCLRTPLDPLRTFSDDPLRMMRAVRFSAQLLFRVEKETLEGIRSCAERLSIVSQERISEELNQLLMSALPSEGLLNMLHAKLLDKVLPELLALKGVQTIGKHSHKDNFFHTLEVLDNVAAMGGELWLRWAAILHDIAKPKTKAYDPQVGWTFHGHEELGARMVAGMFRRLRLPMHRVPYVKKLVRLHLRPIALVSEAVTDSALRRLLYEAGDDVDDLMMLCRADITSKNDKKVQRYLSNFAKVEKRMQQVEEKDRVRNFQPPISGETIMSTFGLQPSALVGEIKQAIKEAILEGKIQNEPATARAFMHKLAEQKGLQNVSEKPA